MISNQLLRSIVDKCAPPEVLAQLNNLDKINDEKRRLEWQARDVLTKIEGLLGIEKPRREYREPAQRVKV